jgi:hypothetical protein
MFSSTAAAVAAIEKCFLKSSAKFVHISQNHEMSQYCGARGETFSARFAALFHVG